MSYFAKEPAMASQKQEKRIITINLLFSEQGNRPKSRKNRAKKK